MYTLLYRTTNTFSVSRAAGMVIANDLEYKRCHLMMHQVKRLLSPLCVVLNHDATVFPNVLLPRDCASSAPAPPSTAPASPSPSAPPPRPGEVPALDVLQYDRILCDVPCSGDGTLRKNGDLWARWSPWMALSLHRYAFDLTSGAHAARDA